MSNSTEGYKVLELNSGFQELNDEVAASCNGGLAPVTLYNNYDFGGSKKDISSNDDNLDNSAIGSGWNNKTSSLIIRRGVWQIFDKEKYNTGGRYAILGPGFYRYPSSFGLANNTLTGIRRLS
ncbi:beta/gamma crystallin-related protein (plasmid) [Nostoc sp. UHCC 0302]|uniref:beta/gamma crystallin-related protein n=1 Tax=Nostoc sp. UHCC 0302 TaxID=3134896 RepID=UPI00311CAC39